MTNASPKHALIGDSISAKSRLEVSSAMQKSREQDARADDASSPPNDGPSIVDQEPCEGKSVAMSEDETVGIAAKEAEASPAKIEDSNQASGTGTTKSSKSSGQASSTEKARSGSSKRPFNYKTRPCLKWQMSTVCSFGSRCNFAHGFHELRLPQDPNGVSPSSQDPKEEKNVNDGIASINKQLELLQYQMQQRIQNMQDMDGKASYLLQQMATGKGPFQQQGNNNNASKRKTKICSKFAQHGCCPYAERCNFAHGEHELLAPSGMPAGGNAQANAGLSGARSAEGAGQGSSSAQSGWPQGNYKTRICLNWQQDGVCSYGSRCNFAHGIHELNLGPNQARMGPVQGVNDIGEHDMFFNAQYPVSPCPPGVINGSNMMGPYPNMMMAHAGMNKLGFPNIPVGSMYPGGPMNPYGHHMAMMNQGHAGGMGPGAMGML